MNERIGPLVVAAAWVVAVACRTTDDPRAGLGIPSSSGGASSGGGGSSSGGLDAALPDAPLDCGALPGADAPFTKQALIGAAAACASYHACTFQNAAAEVSRRIHDGGDARAAWRAAMNEWSRMELFQFGPVGSRVIDRYHGRGLRSFVHPWPDVSRCEVERQVALRDWEKGWDVVFPSGRGLFALEYLLFYEGTDTACLPGSAAGQAWSALAPSELAAKKQDYAEAVASNVLAVAAEIRNLWSPAGEDFAAKLLAHDGYGSEQETLNVIAWSLMYPEREIKDLKLASLAGLREAPPTPETPFAGIEIENIRTNLGAFRSLFQGCSETGAGLGFDDWLVAAGQAALANDMLAALARAEAAAAAFPPFAQATTEQFVSLYQALKPLSDLLKTSFFGSASPLNLKLPATAASDTD